jgi:hypothetical protein
MESPRHYRAGESIEDYCRACKTDRMHTIVVTDADAQPLRVSCGYCHSEHNYRGGPRIQSSAAAARQVQATHEGGAAPRQPNSPAQPPSRAPRGAAFPVVADREVSMSADSDLETLLRRIIREETGISPVVPADRWRGGTLVLRPGTEGLQEKSWPIETFFHKVVMLRNRLRTLEQQVNASELSDDAKVKLQSYITGCYGTLTSFNVLFADDDDHFKGSSGD